MAKNLFFEYQDNAKIRFKKSNCLEHDLVPHHYRIKTDKLDFMVPKKMVKFTEKYVLIPLAHYRQVLVNFYARIDNIQPWLSK
jgi:hypothetical protein